MLLIGLTGGIGAGKSTVAAALARRGAVIIDADVIAREVVEAGSPALAKLVERFGREILRPDGSLDRPKLGTIAFATEQGKKDLEAITHPAIGEEFLRRIADASPDAIVVHDIPLLTEAKRSGDYAGVIVVEAPLETRLDRLEARGMPRDDARQRMEHQASDDERRAIATWVVDNAGDLDAVERQVDAIWAELQRRVRAQD